MRRSLVALALFLLFGLTSSASAQTVADIIRGRITGPDSQPIVNASINVVSLAGGISKTAKTDRNGRFSVMYPNGEGDYFVYVAAIGFQQKRFQVKRLADEEILIADTRLSPAMLDPVNVVADAERRAATRTDNTADASGAARGVGNDAVAAADAGNLAALAASLPGFQLIPGLDGNPDMFSALGLSPDQNNSTLNGAPGGLDLPRDAQTSTSINTGSWDISSGGFSGAQVQTRTASGNNYKNRRLSTQGDAPQLQWTDDVGSDAGAEYGRLSLSGFLSGPVKFNRAYYNTSYQVDRRSQDIQTLFNTDRGALNAAGIAPDSAARLRETLIGLGIPVGMSSIPSGRAAYSARLQGVLDFSPSSASSQAFQISGAANFVFPAPTNAGSSLLTGAPTTNREGKSNAGLIVGRHTAYVWDKVISESWLSLQASSNTNEAYMRFPTGNVRVASELEDGSSSVRNLSFGGHTFQEQSSSQTFIGLKNQLRWFSGGNRHTMRLTTEVRHERTESDQYFNQLGSFSFLSLADLEAGRASSYSRSLNPVSQETGQISGSISLGDAWIPSPTFQFQVGARLDANHFLTQPDFNPAIQETFGVRNDFVPNRVYPSAVAGFTWMYGTAAQIPFQEGFRQGPRATVSAGVRLFQNVRGAELIGGALSNTGLPGSSRTLVCTGPAAPEPDWDLYRTNPAGAPLECADGTSQFATSVPGVTLFDKNFNQSRSIRPEVRWRGAILGNRFNATFSALHSINLNQQSTIDLNFAPTEDFSLESEAGRPVFAPATAIDPVTGAIAPRASRITDDFNRVSSIRSDLQSHSSQFSVQLSPLNFNQTRFRWSVGYNLLSVRDQYVGFSSTVGNPLERGWSTSQTPRHTISYSLSYNFWDYFDIRWGSQFRSGMRYSPMVAGDINGDNTGFNDRAFVFDPSTAADPAVAEGIQSLLDNGSSSARECLASQLGRLAKRNSCTAPWSIAGSNLSITIHPIKLKLPPRANISFSVSNPLGAADLLFNGSDNLKGWGQARNPDQSLLFVRGFDPATQSFKYEVNRRFGATSAQQTTARQPVVITASISFDIGPTRDWQSLKMQLDRGRKVEGNRVTESQLKQYIANSITNPMARILQAGDPLGLTRRQADSLAMLSRGFTLALDSIWTPVARYYGGLDSTYSQSEAHDRFARGREAAVNYLIKVAPTVKKLLTKAQLRRLDPGITNMLEPRYLERVRAGAASSGLGFIFF